MSEFWEQYRRPEWQRKKAAILELANYTCEACGSTDRTLHAHHRFYRKGAKPWEYEDDELVCLCEGCHEETTKKLAEARELMGQLPSYALVEVIGFLKGMLLWTGRYESFPIADFEDGEGLAKAFNLDFHRLWHALRDAGKPTDSVKSDFLSRLRNDVQIDHWTRINRDKAEAQWDFTAGVIGDYLG